MKTLLSILFFIPTLAFGVVQGPVNPADWEGRLAHLDTTTGEILVRGRSWPNESGEIPEWPPNVVPLRQLDRPTPINPDSRLYTTNELEIICGPDANSIPAECNGQTDVIKYVYVSVKRPVDEQKLSVQNEGSYRVEQAIPVQKAMLYMLIQVALNAYRLDAQALPPKWQTFNTKYLAYIQNKVMPIFDCVKTKEAEVDAGTEPNFDSCWPAPVPGELP